MKDSRANEPKADAKREIERQARKMRKRRDASAILTVLSIVLFASPLISAIGSAQSAGSVPIAVQYIFDVWAVLIAAAFMMSRLMSNHDDAPKPGTSTAPAETIVRTVK